MIGQACELVGAGVGGWGRGVEQPPPLQPTSQKRDVGHTVALPVDCRRRSDLGNGDGRGMHGFSPHFRGEMWATRIRLRC